MARRGLVATYPFSASTPEDYKPRNEERFRAQMAQVNADMLDRLANLEQLVDDLQKRVAVLEGGGP